MTPAQRRYIARLRDALRDAVRALDEEINAAGPDDVREHAVLQAHARVAERGRAIAEEAIP